MPRKPVVSGLLTNELRTKFRNLLKAADPNYGPTWEPVSSRLQKIVFEQCADFDERCAFRRFLMERHQQHYNDVVHESELTGAEPGKQGVFS